MQINADETMYRVQQDPIFRYGFTDSSLLSEILPTKRWPKYLFCIFSCPTSMILGSESALSPPDRWAAFDAYTGSMQLFASMDVYPFSETLEQPPHEQFANPGQTLSEARQRVAEVQALVATLAPYFFDDDRGDHVSRRRLLDLLETPKSHGINVWEEAMAPDFFAWLRADS